MHVAAARRARAQALWTSGSITAGPGLAQVTQGLQTFAAAAQPAGLVKNLMGARARASPALARGASERAPDDAHPT